MYVQNLPNIQYFQVCQYLCPEFSKNTQSGKSIYLEAMPDARAGLLLIMISNHNSYLKSIANIYTVPVIYFYFQRMRKDVHYDKSPFLAPLR